MTCGYLVIRRLEGVQRLHNSSLWSWCLAWPWQRRTVCLRRVLRRSASTPPVLTLSHRNPYPILILIMAVDLEVDHSHEIQDVSGHPPMGARAQADCAAVEALPPHG